MEKTIQLTQKTAKALIKQELGISASTLKRVDERTGIAYIYELQLGKYIVSVENDWLERNGLFLFEITDPMGMGSIHKYFHPETLEENFEAGERYRHKVREEIFMSYQWNKEV